MTHPSPTVAQSGEAIDAVRTLQTELRNDYFEMRSAEIQLAEAILSAHAVTVAGRARLQDVQRRLIEAITNPVAALGTPTGERQFLLFLRGTIAEIQDIVDTGALTDEDHARLTRALGSGYLVSGSPDEDDATAAPAFATAPAAAAAPEQAAGMAPALGSALGALPQAAQGAVTAPAQTAGALAGLASGLLDRAGQAEPTADPSERVPDRDEATDVDETPDAKSDAESESDTDADDDDTADDLTEPRRREEPEAPENGPAQTRPARLVQEHT